MQLEHRATLGRGHRVVEVRSEQGTHEPDAGRHGSGHGYQDVAEDLHALRRVQLGRRHLSGPAREADTGLPIVAPWRTMHSPAPPGGGRDAGSQEVLT